MEVDTTRSIPLNICSPFPHSLVWHFEKKGTFSVRNAYHLARERIQPSNGGAFSSSIPNLIGKFWDILWKANVPPKVKTYAWRTCNNYVPTRSNLGYKHITSNLQCVLCNHPNESTLHLLKETHMLNVHGSRSPWTSL